MKCIDKLMITQKLLGIVVALFVASHLSAQTPGKQDIEAAKQEYERAVPPGNEKARLTYVSKLAQIANRLVTDYRQGGRGQRQEELMTTINSELQKHLAPRDIDSKKLSQLLIGKWVSPRRTYIYRANGKSGIEGGPVTGNWRITGNQLIEGDAGGTIILLNSDYLIYSKKDSVFFHSRVKEQ
jgi:hypothetical protein